MTVQSIKTNSLIEQIQQLPPLELLKLLEIITQLLNQAWVKIPLAVNQPKPRFGSGKHLGIIMSDDFDAPLEDFKEYME